MSEMITITIKEKQTEKKIQHDKKKTLLETLLLEEIGKGSFCKGISLCGNCKVRFQKGAPFPTAQERRFFTAQELRDGFRLACQAKPVQDCVVELQFAADSGMNIVSDSSVQTGIEEWNVTKERKREAARTFVVVDIGTTTVVMQLVDAITEEVIGTVKFMNPQRRFGLDVLSRIQAAKEHGEVLKSLIQKAVLQGIVTLKRESGCENPPELLCVTGNTAMLHIFMGYDTEALGKSPFRPVSVACEETTLDGIRTVIMPSVSAFVGADITAGILSTGMQETDKMNLLLDLGTNGEMALGNKESILTCATAAGPAFEGGAEKGIYGSDRIGAVATLLTQGVIEESGYMEMPTTCIYQGKNVEVSLEQIRQLQLAKAAVRAGIEILVKKCGLKSIEELDTVYLAGGFGFFLDAHAAVRIGLLPEVLEDKVKAVGNSALAGARRFGKAYLESKGNVCQLVYMDRIESFNLAKEEEFQELYIQCMNF